MNSQNIIIETLESFINGDMKAFEQIYDQTIKMIYNVIYRIVPNDNDAQDITQDTYIRAFEKRHTFSGLSNLSTWLYKIAVNKALNFSNKQRYINTLRDQLSYFFKQREQASDPPAFDLEEKNRFPIKKLLEKIKPEFRTCLILFEMENKSYQEISEILGINIGTVRSRIYRAKKALRDLYNKMEGNNELPQKR